MNKETVFVILQVISGMIIGSTLVIIVFYSSLVNTYEANGVYNPYYNMVCYSPISILSLEETIYHEECHALVEMDYKHFCYKGDKE